MRAILVRTYQTPDGEYHPIHEVVDLPDGEGDQLQAMYRLLNCRLVTGAGYIGEDHSVWADDEGMDNVEPGTPIWVSNFWPAPLVGRLLITGFDPSTGETRAATMTTGTLAQYIELHGVFRKRESASDGLSGEE